MRRRENAEYRVGLISRANPAGHAYGDMLTISPQSGLDEPVNLGNPYSTSCAIVTDVVVHQAGCRSIRPLFSVEKAL